MFLRALQRFRQRRAGLLSYLAIMRVSQSPYLRGCEDWRGFPRQCRWRVRRTTLLFRPQGLQMARLWAEWGRWTLVEIPSGHHGRVR